MATEDRSESVRSNANLQVGRQTSPNICGNDVQMKNQFLSANNHAPKARKPYTISKQREKWTEEEHKKFIEALKLYGRAWRRIEEYVGTKTAIQIRSHAQKFFCKVVRESNTDNASPVKPIEIPPPRPKRKPSRPYPRKMVVSSKETTLVGEQPRRSTSPHSPTAEQDNQSPTSVVLGLGSEMFDMTDSNTHNGSLSPVSSANIDNTSRFSISEPNASPMESESVLLDQLIDFSARDEQIPMRLDLFPQESVFSREGPTETVPIQSLKLFGKTVLVSGSHSSFSATKVAHEMNDVTSLCSLDWSLNATEFSCLPSLVSQGDIKYALHTPIPTKVHSLLIANERYVGKDGPSSFTNNGSVITNWELDRQSFRLFSSNEENKPQSKLKCVLSENVSSSGQRPCPKTFPSGFVPYKRCLTERDMQMSAMANQEREEQRMRLCL